MPYAAKTKRGFQRIARSVRRSERRFTRVQTRSRQWPRGGFGGASAGGWSVVLTRVVCESGTLVEQWRTATYQPGTGVVYSDWTNSSDTAPPA